jgi:hypothetical protein
MQGTRTSTSYKDPGPINGSPSFPSYLPVLKDTVDKTSGHNLYLTHTRKTGRDVLIEMLKETFSKRGWGKSSLPAAHDMRSL